MDTKQFSLTQTGKPYKSYIKAILGKVHVFVLNPFSNSQESVILEGNPQLGDEGSIIDIWSEVEDNFFKKKNRKHLETGQIIEHIRDENEDIPEEVKLNTLSEDELIELVNSQFFKLKYAVEKMTSLAPVYRLLELAKSLDKTESRIKFLQNRLNEMQMAEYEKLSVTKEETD